MEKPKLIGIAKKLSKLGVNKTPQDIYFKLTKESGYNDFFNLLNPNDFIMLCFLIGNSEMDLDSLYDKIKSNLFVYSLIEVDNLEPYYTCDYCGGEGEINCEYCDGNGEVDCPNCHGDGETSDGEECGKCGGDGQIKCSECRDGLETCSECDGLGEIQKEGYVTAVQHNYISYDSEILHKLELINEFDKIDEDDYFDRDKCILMKTITGETHVLPDPEQDDIYFYEYSDYDLKLKKSGKGIDTYTLDDLV